MLMGVTEARREEMDTPIALSDRARYDEAVQAVRALLGAGQRQHGYEAQSLRLTEREVEVLGLLVVGLTNKEIAERLVLSHRTVQAHLYSIFSKLNVTTRSAATRMADGY